LQMYTDGPEMNFRTESFDLPQNEQRRCLSVDISVWKQIRGAGAVNHFHVVSACEM